MGIINAEFAHDVPPMRVDCTPLNPQSLCNKFGGHSIPDEAQDVLLGIRQLPHSRWKADRRSDNAYFFQGDTAKPNAHVDTSAVNGYFCEEMLSFVEDDTAGIRCLYRFHIVARYPLPRGGTHDQMTAPPPGSMFIGPNEVTVSVE